MNYRATIGLFNEAGLLMAHVASKVFEYHSEAKRWALDQLYFHSPSPYKYSIDPVL